MKGKFIKSIFAFILCFVILFPMTACGSSYHAESGKIEEVAGTYKLTTYNKAREDDTHYSALEEKSMKAYLVVGSDGHGYYAYQDNETELTVDTILITYTYEKDDDTLIRSISYDAGNVHKNISLKNQKPGAGHEPTMGFTVSNHSLNYSIPKDGDVEYSSAVYTRISTDTDLTTIRSEFGKTTETLPEPTRFELKNLGDFVYMSISSIPSDSTKPNANANCGKFDYVVLDLTTITNNAFVVHYKIVGESTEKVAIGTITYSAVKNTQPNYMAATFNILGNDYLLDVDTFRAPNSLLYRQVFENSTLLYSENFTKYLGTKTTIDEVIAEIDANSAISPVPTYY